MGVMTWDLRRANKDYQCGKCDNIIHKGENYEYMVGADGINWEVYRSCYKCANIEKFGKLNKGAFK